jgi:YD repeat-containing protein
VLTGRVPVAGLVRAVTDILGRQTRLVLDKLNRVTATTDALCGQTSFAYDPNSNLQTLTDALTVLTPCMLDPLQCSPWPLTRWPDHEFALRLDPDTLFGLVWKCRSLLHVARMNSGVDE